MGTLGVFIAIAGMLFAADMLAHRKAAALSLGNATAWTLIYIIGAMVFAGYLWAKGGPNVASLFLAGFVMEKALSVDNLMVFVAIFAYFRIPDEYQHRVLHYGIIGAVVFRLIFVALGAGALEVWGAPVGLLFGLVVLWSAFKMWTAMPGEDDEPVDYSKQWYARWAAKILPFVDHSFGNKFFISLSVIKNFDLTHFSIDPPGEISMGGYGESVMRRVGTPLLMCLIAIEISDVLFSFDSVPAVIAVTQDPVLVYSAMIFAILGLRQLYFVLTALLRYLTRLGGAVVLVLGFIGVKLVATAGGQLARLWGYDTPGYIEITPVTSLIVVLGLLAGGVAASLLWPQEPEPINATHNG